MLSVYYPFGIPLLTCHLFADKVSKSFIIGKLAFLKKWKYPSIWASLERMDWLCSSVTSQALTQGVKSFKGECFFCSD